MIQILRIDERMIHGQIAVAWTKTLGSTHIVVANDEVANDNLQKRVLLLAAPPGIKVAIKTLNESVNLLSDPRVANFRIMLIVRTVEDAYKLIKSNKLDIPLLNVGNVGKIFKGEDLKVKSQYVNLAEKDIEMLKEIEQVIPVEVQILPNSKKSDLNSLLK